MYLDKLKQVGRTTGRLTQSFLAILLIIFGAITCPGAAIAAPDFLQTGINALQQQSYPTAIEYLTKATQQSENLDKVYGSRCLAYLLLNTPQLAEQDCSTALNLNSDYPKAYFYRGLARYWLAQYESAISDFAQHLEKHPQDARAYYNSGLAQFAQSNIGEAIHNYNIALSYSADLNRIELSNLYNDLGVAYLATAQTDVALVILDKAIALDSEDPRAYFNRGCICHHRGDYGAALEDFDQALMLDPAQAETYLNRSLSKQRLGDSAGAIADLEAAIETFQVQDDWSNYYRAKQRLQYLKQPQSAIG
ncbi:tetratricopeptide repeat protein [Oscillatoria sp. CS-180]|uniref:tetratricopeptide repeat protein n=1 Tax=Oscillatoria sp. CS-180 TaxID=3021720 RepID=UPI00232B2829|nr:tetratricopeptide repeat protein [Oscillatoria sp. CS-180]MDB9525381.1 tetratricopeptide repeat protein [Oscillatoria sp. CS-180]